MLYRAIEEVAKGPRSGHRREENREMMQGISGKIDTEVWYDWYDASPKLAVFSRIRQHVKQGMLL